MTVDIKKYTILDLMRLVSQWEKLTPYMQKLLAERLLELLLQSNNSRGEFVSKIEKILEEYYD